MEYVNLSGYLAALLLVLVLAGVAILIKRYANNPSALQRDLKGRLGKFAIALPERRLAVVESLVIGPRQRLMIVRRDTVEHLVLSSPDGASVLEANIPAKDSAP